MSIEEVGKMTRDGLEFDILYAGNRWVYTRRGSICEQIGYTDFRDDALGIAGIWSRSDWHSIFFPETWGNKRILLTWPRLHLKEI
jgi:hypothetical protein